ncbi:MAG TPA: two-component regulator propeller domain-containing protein, partial [Saprospiraceae bacterium]|nr:two-component regulator propeller domain-containing protein [Saprospiraceae bacterium]
MSVKLIIYISVLAILCTYNNAIAQDYNFIVKRYTIEDGLSHRAVNFILQASDGFIWIGTDQGLNRFDGYDFKFWTKTDNGLLNDQINFIYEDPDKLLWLFSHNSYNSEVEIFDPSTEKSISFIKKFKSKLPYPNVQLTEYHVIDKSGAIYIGTTNPTGILKYHPKTGFKQILTKEGYVFGPEIYTGKNTIWGKFYTFSTLPENANEVEMDLNGHILNDIGKKAYIKQDNNKSFSEDGSFYYEKQPIVNGLIQTWHHDKDNHEIHLSRNDYFRDTYQLFPLWTYLKDKKLLANEKSIEIVKTGEKIFEFSDYLPEFKRQGIKTWFIDRSGLLWIGYDLGICCLEIQENQFKNFLFNGNNHSYGIPCRNIMPMKDGTVRVNTETYGQWSINWKTGKAEQINYYPSALYYGFGKDNLNNLYYSTSTSTIERFSLDKSKKQYHWIGADIWSFYNYKNQQMFMGPSNKGIMLFDFKTESVKPYTKYNGYDELTSATIYYFKEDKIGNIWACAETGLYEINPIKGVVGRYWSGGTGKNYLPSDYILHFYLDQENIFWLATSGGGLIKWDKEKGIATRFGRKSGLPVETIYGVYEDKHKHLWLPSQFGIIQFDKRKGEVRRIFGLANGITQEEFNRISHAMDSNGILYFGGLNGITSFNPESFYGQSNVKNAPLVIAECQKFDGNSGKIVDISADVIKKKYIELLPSDKYFTINVALLSYFETAKIQYAYRFDNENDWQFQKDRILRFSNLTYGDKKLHIKAQGADGIWSANELLLTINQLRPFYYQWWFILIIIMTLLGLLRWRLWSLNKRQKQLEE